MSKMDKLRQQTADELANAYYDTFGYSAETDNKDKIIASLYYGKRITSLTEEEISGIDEL